MIRYLGYLLLINGAWMLVQRITARGMAMGKVVDHEVRAADSTDVATEVTTYYSPVIEFVDQEKRKRRFTATKADTSRTPQRGTLVRVRYRPRNPDDAYVATFAQMWIMPIAWLACGAVAVYYSRP